MLNPKQPTFCNCTPLPIISNDSSQIKLLNYKMKMFQDILFNLEKKKRSTFWFKCKEDAACSRYHSFFCDTSHWELSNIHAIREGTLPQSLICRGGWSRSARKLFSEIFHRLTHNPLTRPKFEANFASQQNNNNNKSCQSGKVNCKLSIFYELVCRCSPCKGAIHNWFWVSCWRF